MSSGGTVHDFGNGERKLDIAFVNGATATVKIGPLRFFGIWTHVTPQGVGGGVDWLEGAFCGGPKNFAICTRGGLFGGDVIDRAGNVKNAYATGSISFGLPFDTNSVIAGAKNTSQ